MLTEQLSEYDHVNVQVALDALGGERELIGLPLDRGFRVSLAELAGSGSKYGMELEPGPPEYAPVDVGDRTISSHVSRGCCCSSPTGCRWRCCSRRWTTTATRACCSCTRL